MPNVTLAFVGDIMLGRGVSAAIAAGRRPEDFWGDVRPSLLAADAVVANLESPITAHEEEWRRTPKAFRYRAHPAAVDVLSAANVRFACLANNHILDQETGGLHDTLCHLDAAGIAYAGAGANSEQAAAPVLREVNGVPVGMMALTDTMPEFSAGPARAGTNYMRIDSGHATLSLIRSSVRELRRAGATVVILSAHWGPNLRPWPPARFRRFARAAIDLGVDVFHGHSAHLLQGAERHAGGVILYDTGNILDDYWVFPFIRIDRSIVFLAEFAGGRLGRLRMIPVSLSRTRARLAVGREFEAIRRRMSRCCARLGAVVALTREGLELAAPHPAEAAPQPAALRSLCPAPAAGASARG